MLARGLTESYCYNGLSVVAHVHPSVSKKFYIYPDVDHSCRIRVVSGPGRLGLGLHKTTFLGWVVSATFL